jgi:hypothetical protein
MNYKIRDGWDLHKITFNCDVGFWDIGHATRGQVTVIMAYIEDKLETNYWTTLASYAQFYLNISVLSQVIQLSAGSWGLNTCRLYVKFQANPFIPI